MQKLVIAFVGVLAFGYAHAQQTNIPPRPDLKINVNNAPLDERRGIVKSAATLSVDALPHEAMPQPRGTYRITEMHVNLVRGGRRVAHQRVESGQVSLETFENQVQSGDRYVLEISTAYQWKGQETPVSSHHIVTVPVN